MAKDNKVLDGNAYSVPVIEIDDVDNHSIEELQEASIKLGETQIFHAGDATHNALSRDWKSKRSELEHQKLEQRIETISNFIELNHEELFGTNGVQAIVIRTHTPVKHEGKVVGIEKPIDESTGKEVPFVISLMEDTRMVNVKTKNYYR